MSAFQMGDLFTVDPSLYPVSTHGTVFKVSVVPTGSRVNYVGQAVVRVGEPPVWSPSGQRGVKAKAEHMRPVDPEHGYVAEVIPYVPLPPLYSLVRLNEAHGKAPAGLYVVLDWPSRRPTDIKVGLVGSSGTYWPHLPATWFEPIESDRIKVLD